MHFLLLLFVCCCTQLFACEYVRIWCEWFCTNNRQIILRKNRSHIRQLTKGAARNTVAFCQNPHFSAQIPTHRGIHQGQRPIPHGIWKAQWRGLVGLRWAHAFVVRKICGDKAASSGGWPWLWRWSHCARSSIHNCQRNSHRRWMARGRLMKERALSWNHGMPWNWKSTRTLPAPAEWMIFYFGQILSN